MKPKNILGLALMTPLVLLMYCALYKILLSIDDIVPVLLLLASVLMFACGIILIEDDIK